MSVITLLTPNNPIAVTLEDVPNRPISSITVDVASKPISSTTADVPNKAIDAVTSDKLCTAVIVGPASTAPVHALNPKTVPLRLASNGNSIDTALSESCSLIPREAASLKSDCIAVTVSNSVFSLATSNAPELGKSVVRERGIALVMTTVLPPVAPVTVVVTVPVEPLPPLTVYKDVFDVLASNVRATLSTKTLRSVDAVKNTNGTANEV